MYKHLHLAIAPDNDPPSAEDASTYNVMGPHNSFAPVPGYSDENRLLLRGGQTTQLGTLLMDAET